MTEFVKLRAKPLAELETVTSASADEYLLLRKTGADPKKILPSSIGGGGVSLPVTATQAEAEAGTVEALRSFSPLRLAQAIGALGKGRSVIWCEEGAAFDPTNNDGYQWSWGNGAQGGVLVFPFAAKVVGVGLSSNWATSATIEVYVDGVATGATVSISSEFNAYAAADVSIPAGGTLRFRTTSGSNGGRSVASVGILA